MKYSDKMYLISLIQKFFKSTEGCIYIDVRRPDYNVSNIIERLQEMPLIIKKLSIEPDFFDGSFSCLGDEITHELLYALADLWFAFEHRMYCFFANKEVSQLKKGWSEILQQNHVPT
ncbi:hypothetical protein [uncultured Chitinophaga sp.]|jgi:hypothetical protein|uniref:hypothetical protein n=1 Tax=uncultured Chitinophaga sp. TaxID=339340 RepID=UPI00262147BF|nr:hypothetical protein [uncultured Chitinophaga sp.]